MEISPDSSHFDIFFIGFEIIFWEPHIQCSNSLEHSREQTSSPNVQNFFLDSI